MHGEYGGLYVTGGTANFTVPAAGAEFIFGTAIAPSQHGNQAVVGSTSTGRLTLSPGVYKVDLDMTIEGNHSSGFSGDFAGVITASIARAGVLLTGTKTKVQTITEGLPMACHVSAIVEISQALQDAGTNYVAPWLIAADASGNDIVVTEGRILAVRLS